MAACGSQPVARPQTRVLRQHYFTSGHHYWEVLIERALSPRSLVVGVTAVSASPSEWTTDALGYSASGVILGNGVQARRAQPFGEGDTVGVMLDMNAKCAAFFLNEEPQRDPDVDPPAGRPFDAETAAPHRQEELGNMELEMKGPVHTRATSERRVIWHTFHARTMFAAVTISSEKDAVVVYKAEVPEGYR